MRAPYAPGWLRRVRARRLALFFADLPGSSARGIEEWERPMVERAQELAAAYASALEKTMRVAVGFDGSGSDDTVAWGKPDPVRELDAAQAQIEAQFGAFRDRDVSSYVEQFNAHVREVAGVTLRPTIHVSEDGWWQAEVRTE